MALALLLLPAPASALRCGTRLVDVGDSKYDVLHRCGEPAATELRQEELIEEEGSGRRRVITVTEEWIYNFGPSSFLYVLLFHEDRLVWIETRGYGFLPGVPPGGSCDTGTMSVGDTKFEVLMRCGEPAYRSTREEELTEPIDRFSRRRRLVVIEEWTYDFGPLRFIKILTFRNGRLTGIATGDRGY